MRIIDYTGEIVMTTLIGAFLWWGVNTVLDVKKDMEKINRLKAMPYQEVIAEIKTPEEAAWYTRTYMIPQESGSFVKSFRKVHEERTGDCADATSTAAALLSDDGYPAYYLGMQNEGDKVGHMVYFYEKDGKYGTIGVNSSDVLSPRFSNLDEIVRHFGYEKYIYGVIDEKVIPDWISTDRNLMFSKEEMEKYGAAKVYDSSKNNYTP